MNCRPEGFLESKLEVRVLALQLLDPLGTGARRARRRFERFHSCLGVDCPPAKGRQLVTEVTDELVEVRESLFQLSLFVV